MTQAQEGSLGTLYHPLTGEQLENPYPFLARARQEEPVFFSPELNSWIVTRYDDILAILNQPDLFSSKDTLRPVVRYTPAVFGELSKGYPLVPNLIDSDGQEHVRFRNAVGKAFAPARIKKLEPFIQEIVTSLVDCFIEHHQAEIVSQLAYPLPLEVALFLIGIPKEDMAFAKRLSDNLAMFISSPLSEEVQVAYARDFVTLHHYFIRLVNERRQAPREDLISDVLETPPGETPFTDAQLANLFTSILIAGHETTTQLIGNTLVLLLEQPDRWQTLCSHPERISQAIEECLRYDAPVHAFFRTTTQEVTVGGVTLPPETSLLIVFGSANRDESQFPHADQFDMQRTPNRHLAFGYGIHYCLGAFLARKQAQIVLETLCQRLPTLRLAPGQTLLHAPVLRQRGFTRIDVVW